MTSEYPQAGRRNQPERPLPYLPTVTPAVERKASLTLVAFMSSSTSRVRTVVCPGVLRIGSTASGDESRLALYGAAGSISGARSAAGVRTAFCFARLVALSVSDRE